MTRTDLAAARAILRRTLAEQALSGAITGLGLLAIGIYVTQIYQIAVVDTGLEEVFNNLPQFLQNFAGSQGGIGTPLGFINSYAFGVICPAIIIAFAIIRGANLIAGEEESGTLDQLLANPVGRIPAMIAKWAALEIAIAALAATLFASLYIGGLIAGIGLQPQGIAQAAGSLFLLGSATATITLAIGAATGRKPLAAGTVAAVVVFGYLVNTFRTLAEVVDYLSLLSLIYFYNGEGIAVNGLVWWHALALIAITAAALLIGALYFKDRDLQ